jgi:hypothetical protein
MRSLVPVVLLVILSPAARAAGPKPLPATVVFKDGTRVELKSFEVATSSKGLFGTSSTRLDKLPIKGENFVLKVELRKLARIEFVKVDKKAKRIEVRLTSVGGESYTGVVGSEKDVVWKGTHPFTDAEAVLDPARIKEILLQPKK